jgi:hypothetical protein
VFFDLRFSIFDSRSSILLAKLIRGGTPNTLAVGLQDLPANFQIKAVKPLF